jgi:ribose 5-phosphate isomerase B
MRIAVGSDHAGYGLKVLLVDHLKELGYQIEDLGTHNGVDSVDYPDFGAAVGRKVASGEAELGLCTCGTGIGISMAANKISGIRAAVVHDVTTGQLAREHNHANVVCFGARTTGIQTALDALDAFLTASEQSGRHEHRIEKLHQLDEGMAVLR